ncbi:MAG: RluA family pseudouridine synthase [Pseudomonadota bacterium]
MTGGDTANPAAGQRSAKLIEVDDKSEGQRIDNFLVRVMKGVPKTRIYKALRKGEVRVNSKRVNARYALRLGDKVRIPPIRVSAEGPPKTLPDGFQDQIEILHEDDDLMVINKPTGLAVHGGTGQRIGLIEGLRLLRPQSSYLELVHRIDRETSGCLMIAKSRMSLLKLQSQLTSSTMEKHYTALMCGCPPDEHIRIDHGLAQKKQASGRKRMVIDRNGQHALTVFRRLECVGDFAFVSARIHTGRMHQVRVHAQALGHPLAGDDLYGDFSRNKQLRKYGLKRLFLHARKLHLKHPTGNRDLVVEAPLPCDLSRCLQHLRDMQLNAISDDV